MSVSYCSIAETKCVQRVRVRDGRTRAWQHEPLRAHIFIPKQETQRGTVNGVILSKPQSLPPMTNFPYLYFPNIPPIDDQILKYINIWKAFLFRLPESVTILVVLYGKINCICAGYYL